jgi:hypothetical protein
MIKVPDNCFAHVLCAIETELERQRVISERGEDTWPIDFDPNDAPLYEMARESLQRSPGNADGQLDLSGKTLWFLLDLIPAYVNKNINRLSPAEYSALKHLYAEQHPSRKTSFPSPQ